MEHFPAPGNAFRSISEMGAMLTMLTTGIKSGPSPDGNGGDGIKSGAAAKSSGGIRSKKVSTSKAKKERSGIP